MKGSLGNTMLWIREQDPLKQGLKHSLYDSGAMYVLSIHS